MTGLLSIYGAVAVSRICSVEDCDKSVICKGMCRKHDKHRWIKKNRLENPEYYVWLNMKSRCFNINTPTYKNYGGRGITVCNRWLKYANFIEDMGRRPNGMTLERKNNDSNYQPDNCIWADWATQSSNKRRVLAQSGQRYIHRKTNRGWDVRVVRQKTTVFRETYLLLEDAILGRDNFFKSNPQYAIEYPTKEGETP